jgi:type IV secretion system protein VirD4
VTAKTGPVRAQRQAPVPVAPPKPPGRATLAFRRKREQATRTALPYAAGLTVTLAADLALHQPGLLWLGGGAVAASAAHRVVEAHGWYRAGGNAAARKRRKFQGTATRGDIRRALSPQAAARHAAVACPDLHPAYAPVVIGRAVKPSRVIAGSREDGFLVIAPPRSLKTALISCWAADAPGALLATSSRTDLYAHTAIPREAMGPVWVLNPDGDGGIPTTLAWSPLEGCRNPRIAKRRAGDLIAASPKSGKDDAGYWAAMGAGLITVMLHAAAITGQTMREVAAWCRNPWAPEIGEAYKRDDADQMLALKLASLIGGEGEHLNGIIGAAEVALDWVDDPVMGAVACPAPGEGFDCAGFATSSGTVYLIAEDRHHGSVAPYFAAFAAEVFEQAKQAAAANGGRLPIPMTFALDEAATICPVPLHKWTSVAAGYNITVAAGLQALSQLTARWGEHDGQTIFTNMTVKVIGGGFTYHDELERLSAVCGDVDTWDEVKAPDGGKTKQHRQERLYPPERIRQLARWHVLVLHRSTRPVEAVITPVWDRKGYERAETGHGAFTLPAARPAIEAARREPIALPAGPSAPPAITDAVIPEQAIPATPEEVSWPATISA